MEQKECIICDKGQFSHFLDVKCRYSKEHFSLNKCKCSFISTSPQPSEEEIDYYYENINYDPHASANSSTSYFNLLFRKFSYSWKYKLLQKYLVNISNPKVIDIGGGDGSLAIYLKSKGVKVDVYEKNLKCVEFIKNKNIFASNELSVFKSNDYDLVMLWHSLEHIHDIEFLFTELRRITSKKAFIIIATPNNLASEVNIFKEKWVAWDAPRHLHHFNYKTLDLLTRKYNWEIVDRHGVQQDTFFNIYNSINANVLVKILLFIFIGMYSFLIQLFSKNKTSSNLVVCEKR